MPLRYTGPWADRGRDIYRWGLLIPQPRSYLPLGAVPAGVAQHCPGDPGVTRAFRMGLLCAGWPHGKDQ